MSKIVLEPHFGSSPADLAATLRSSGVAQGDSVLIRRARSLDERKWGSLLLLALIAIVIAADKRWKRDSTWSEELLNDLFNGTGDPVALERVIEERTGVDITVEDGGEWPTAGMYLLDRAYGDDEPDISGLTAREPNPDHRP